MDSVKQLNKNVWFFNNDHKIAYNIWMLHRWQEFFQELNIGYIIWFAQNQATLSAPFYRWGFRGIEKPGVLTMIMQLLVSKVIKKWIEWDRGNCICSSSVGLGSQRGQNISAIDLFNIHLSDEKQK